MRNREPRWIELERRAWDEGRRLLRDAASLYANAIRRREAQIAELLSDARRFAPHRSSVELEIRREAAGLPANPTGVLRSST